MYFTETSLFVDDIIKHYNPGEVTVPITAGKHLPALDMARQEAQAHMDAAFGVHVPEALTAQDYTHSDQDKQDLAGLRRQLEANLTPEEGELWERTASGRVLVGQEVVQQHYVRLRNNVLDVRRVDYVSRLPLEVVEPVLELTQPLQEVSRPQGLHDSGSLDCVLDVFNMNVARIADDAQISKVSFYNLAARQLVEASEDVHVRGLMHNLPQLLGSLTTAYAKDRLQHTVRVRGFVGADFAEIEQMYIDPIAKRLPAAKFILNVLLSSEKVRMANHAVTITKAQEDKITVQDPKYGLEILSPEQFWRRWVATHMQAALTIAVPVSK